MSEIVKSKQLKLPKWKTIQMAWTEERISACGMLKWWNITEQ